MHRKTEIRFRLSVLGRGANLLLQAAAFAALPIVGGPIYVAGEEWRLMQRHESRAAVTNDGLTVGWSGKPSLDFPDAYSEARGIYLDLRSRNYGTIAGITLPNQPVEFTFAASINAAGMLVGRVNGNIGSRAARWSSHTAMPELLGTLTANTDDMATSYAVGIDAAGNAYGYETGTLTRSTRYPVTPVRWDTAGVATALNVLPHNFQYSLPSRVKAVNLSGTAIGESAQQAARWDAGGTAVTKLYGPQHNSNPSVIGINTRGVIIGSATKQSPNGENGERALRWSPGATTATELGTLGLDATKFTRSGALAIGPTGAAVGFANKYVGGTARGTRAARWRDGETVAHELGSFGLDSAGNTTSEAEAINALDVAVGFAHRFNAAGVDLGPHAALWRADDIAVDLNQYLAADSGWTLTHATHVTDTGFISGRASFRVSAPAYDTQERLFTMLVPEAGTYGRGDANFDTAVNFADLVVLAQNYNKANADQDVDVADFNLDGVTNFADLVALAQNYNTGVANVASLGNSALAADWAHAQSLVPEPTAVAAVAVALPLARRRRP